MYLSRVALNKRRQNTMAVLASPHKIHATVESSFPPGFATGVRNLWRLDRLGNNLYLLVLSGAKPDFTHVVEQYGWPNSGQGWETKDYTRLLNRIQAGQKWQFRLRANPVHSVKQKTASEEKEDARRGKVYAHTTVQQQERWLLERAGKYGFFLKEEWFRVIQRETKRFQRQGETVTLGTVTFDGILEVTDAPLFQEALIRGIGRAKAYGCGLLTVAKVPS
ncbi:MAG TPA: type I-E CRISPR-associated protein Cas6/Cse3/CasE [Firmicutes bacterium]|jgi:CRISPR system Cascade subunit CasE|nr:type I-E CRISPR-associated protein Cas6/Cse3/CasE [Bacillota bacterium]